MIVLDRKMAKNYLDILIFVLLVCPHATSIKISMWDGYPCAKAALHNARTVHARHTKHGLACNLNDL